MCMAHEEVRLRPRAPPRPNLSDEDLGEDCQSSIEEGTILHKHWGCDNELTMVQIENTFAEASTHFCWNGVEINMLIFLQQSKDLSSPARIVTRLRIWTIGSSTWEETCRRRRTQSGLARPLDAAGRLGCGMMTSVSVPC